MAGLSISKYDYASDLMPDINITLEKGASLLFLNEPWLVERLNELEARSDPASPVYWLTMARLNELALYCAGNYADNGEYCSVGDLLVNPRLILVHVRGQSRPIIKKRHTPLSKQFAKMADGAQMTYWLKRNTVVEIVEKPILVELHNRLTDSGMMSKDYLESVVVRHQQIAHTTTFLASTPLSQFSGFEEYSRYASPQDQEYIKSQLCLFDTSLFNEIGNDLQIMTLSPEYYSPFLS